MDLLWQPNFGRLYLHASGIVLGEMETKIDELVADRYAEAMELQRAMFRAGQRAGPGHIAPVRMRRRDMNSRA